MHNRDQLDTFWPKNFTAKDNAERPAEGHVSRDGGLELRLAVLLLRLPGEEARAESRVRRRRQAGRTLHDVHVAGRGVPGALGACGHQVLHRHAVPGEVSQRRVHRLPRIVESLAAAAGWLQHHVPAVRRRQAVGRVRGVRRRLHREDAARESERRRGAPGRCRAGARRIALYRRESEGQDLARDGGK